MAVKGAVCALILALAVSSIRGQIEFGFSEGDFTGSESDGRTVLVTKTGANVGDLFIDISPLTYNELESMGFPIPGVGNRPEPAEFSSDPLTGTRDFDNTVQTVVFPATTSGDRVDIAINISFVDDMINEADEGFYLHATVDSVNSSPIDEQSAMPDSRNGVTLIRITDDDEISLVFEQSTYSVSETDGEQNNLIYIVKQGVTEQTLMIVMGGDSLDTATRGPDGDYVLPILGEDLSSDTTLVFEASESRRNIPFEVFDDTILEASVETFQLILLIPDNPPLNHVTGPSVLTRTTVSIVDDEGATIGFTSTKHFINETDGTVDICVGMLDNNATEISAGVQAFLFVETVNGTALAGEDFVQLIGGRFTGDNIDILGPDFLGCARLTITDDDEAEGTETLQLRLITNDTDNGFASSNFVYDPVIAEVCILDDEQPPTGTPPSTTMPPTQDPDTTMMPAPPVGMGGDPHYSILLPTGQLLCYSVQGEHEFVFNLISNKVLQMNALFVKDSKREEVTWIGELGVVVRHGPKKRANTTALRFCAPGNMICIGDKVKLHASGVEKITFSQGKLSVSERAEEGDKERPDVLVEFPDVGISFTVMFVREKHLDMTWNKVEAKMDNSHGMIGQFFRSGVEIDEARRLLVLPDMEPVPVMRKPVWHFMERDSPDEQLCWVAMNPGYQGKKLLQGHYLDYLVDDVLSTNFKFKPKKYKKKTA